MKEIVKQNSSVITFDQVPLLNSPIIVFRLNNNKGILVPIEYYHLPSKEQKYYMRALDNSFGKGNGWTHKGTLEEIYEKVIKQNSNNDEIRFYALDNINELACFIIS